MTPQVVYLNPCPSIGIKVPVLDDRHLPMPVVRRPETIDVGFIPSPPARRAQDYIAEALLVAGTLFAAGVVPAAVVVFSFAWGA